ncbi:hypothetical protein M422DRAFT_251429 [Sphaerobolus stellatus SS14]|uniref:protein-tyrosine-phosphatase n=1 Tax=Sphaerobolus stellatus (strain SS14) TaxID=990650 RepID=A0A0C9VDW3_SPHS4|nr:hypothetical protein M422DRAFT_251429 [Sphaerobolus stellatus SS14]
MDFFSSHHDSRLSSTTSAPSTDPFAQEIGRRFSQPILTARLSPAVAPQSPHASSSSSTTTTTIPAPASPSTRLNSLSLRSKPAAPAPFDSRIVAVDPAGLLAVLDTPHVLVLDIRPHATFGQSRIPHALSLSVPSTLLKRPAFPLDKLTEMLSSAAGRRKFSTWKTASRILVYDADSQAIPDGSNIRGLLRKFEREGFRGELAWLKGGFAAVWRERHYLVDSGPPSPDSSEEEDSTLGYLRTRKLPSAAFQQSSTTSASHRPAQSAAERRPAAPPPMSTRQVAANPFYDNIRQNRELAHGITERIPLRLPPHVIARRDDLPFDWLKAILDKAEVDDGTESLAMQFYMIELREQRRLMGVMDHHSREGGSKNEPLFPYSITAGVEKGSKNRYQNIWPFEHARVRLRSAVDDGSDYINASHVQPLGTPRRYIATQGPLPTTYTDFWTLCWEQNVSVIVMLTRQIEGALEKCGCYWRQNTYGPFRLDLVSSDGDEEIEVRSAAPQLGFDFGVPTMPVDADKSIVRRTFMFSHADYPEIPPRKVTQLQYLGWPDFDVPDDPKGLLVLMKQVNALRAESRSQDPVLLHCSAGIGRTGGYIMIDAALDGIRYELHKQRQKAEDAVETSDDMDVDGKSSPPWRQQSDSEPESSPGEESTSSWARPPSLVTTRGWTTHARAQNGGTKSGNGNGLLPSVFANDTDVRMPKAVPPTKAFLKLLGDAASSAATHPPRSETDSKQHSDPSTAESSQTTLPSLFTGGTSSRDRSTGVTSSVPLSVESSRSTSPTAAELLQGVDMAFDYTNPRRLHNNASPKLLSHYTEPVRCILEDMREQRMSLCQSLRQYVFVHRAIIEGALEIVDDERAGLVNVGAQTSQNQNAGVMSMGMCVDDAGPGLLSGFDWASGKRGPSPTELLPVDKRGAARLVKRPSFKRRDRSDVSSVATECPAAQ